MSEGYSMGSIMDSLARRFGGDGASPLLKPYVHDAAAFANDLIFKGTKRKMTPYQEEILSAISTRSRVCVRAGRGSGKSSLAAITILWWALTRDGSDFKVLTTASVWSQLELYLWPEVHKWASSLHWQKMGRAPFRAEKEIMKTGLRLDTGKASAISPDKPTSIEGAHADHLAYILDEAKAVDDGIWTSVEGSFASGTAQESLALAISTPGIPDGEFWRICTKKPGKESWWVRHVTLEESIAAGRVDAAFAEEKRRDWGEESSLYRNHLLAEFAGEDEGGIIPLAWIELAVERWKERCPKDKDGRPRISGWQPIGPLTHIGIDVAEAGNDKTCFALRHGWQVAPPALYAGNSVQQTIREAARYMNKSPEAIAISDANGVGAGVYTGLKEQFGASRSHPFKAQSSGDVYKDPSGQIRFANARSAATYAFRSLLDPDKGEPIELPPDDMMIADLVSMRRRSIASERYYVELKADIQKRIGRSPDKGEAVIMAFWPGRRTTKARVGGAAAYA